MADTDDRIDDAAPAQGTAVELPATPAAKVPLRRRVIAPEQTALSSATPSLPPVEAVHGAEPVVAPAKLQVDPVTTAKEPAKELAADKPASGAGSPGLAANPKTAKPLQVTTPAKPVAAKPVPITTPAKPVAAKPVPITKPAKPVAAKPLPPQHVAPAKVAPAKAAPAKSATPAKSQPPFSAAKSAVAPARTAPVAPTAATASSSASKPKDKIMDMSANFSSFQDAISDAQAKAQAAFEKSSTVFGEVGEFAKGNVEAMIASGKILAEGAQEIGSTFVAEGRTVFESMTGDIKELAAAKSPTDFLKLQGDMVRKNFDTAVTYGSKNSETFLKLMNDAFAPLSGRVSLAVEKARQAAPLNAAPVNTAAV